MATQQYVTSKQAERLSAIAYQARVQIGKDVGLSEVQVRNIFRGNARCTTDKALAAVSAGEAYLKNKK